MNEIIIEKVLEIVKNANGIKASEIAKKLKTSRKEINKILYGRLSKLCVRDEQYLWYPCSEHVLDKASNLAGLAIIEEAFSNKDFTVEELETYLNSSENW